MRRARALRGFSLGPNDPVVPAPVSSTGRRAPVVPAPEPESRGAGAVDTGVRRYDEMGPV